MRNDYFCSKVTHSNNSWLAGCSQMIHLSALANALGLRHHFILPFLPKKTQNGTLYHGPYALYNGMDGGWEEVLPHHRIPRR